MKWTLAHTETAAGVTYRLYVQPETDTTPEDDLKDAPSALKWVQDQQSQGNVWAWAMLRVTATWQGTDSPTGEDYLGACSYKDCKNFLGANDYWPQMKQQALNDLMSQGAAPTPAPQPQYAMIQLVTGGTQVRPYPRRLYVLCEIKTYSDDLRATNPIKAWKATLEDWNAVPEEYRELARGAMKIQITPREYKDHCKRHGIKP